MSEQQRRALLLVCLTLSSWAVGAEEPPPPPEPQPVVTGEVELPLRGRDYVAGVRVKLPADVTPAQIRLQRAHGDGAGWTDVPRRVTVAREKGGEATIVFPVAGDGDGGESATFRIAVYAEVAPGVSEFQGAGPCLFANGDFETPGDHPREAAQWQWLPYRGVEVITRDACRGRRCLRLVAPQAHRVGAVATPGEPGLKIRGGESYDIRFAWRADDDAQVDVEVVLYWFDDAGRQTGRQSLKRLQGARHDYAMFDQRVQAPGEARYVKLLFATFRTDAALLVDDVVIAPTHLPSVALNPVPPPAESVPPATDATEP